MKTTEQTPTTTEARMRAAADADRKAAAEYRALQDRTMRENQETTRRMVRGF
jgi:hypothetical protein